ncbi:thiamine diphosphokinase [Intestinibacter sp.]|uniref:thiamine diphosphokinase n=1 Tax=Intestinibacter sp. TaxID=1965304 RepID=UPI002A91F5BA|nr:thiamine diphosphokinase [Intestinibacter sp.]MDY5212124.1 thiamine diphosphokinase [Intestinibacter sp.]
MKICIVLNGSVNDYNKTKQIIHKENYDYIIGADGGCNHLYNMGILPNYVIGDLDSINKDLIKYYESKNIIFKKFPTHKDQTDAEICIHLAKTLNATEIHFIGALGGRIDHALSNIGLMYYVLEMGIEPKILTSEEEVVIIHNDTKVIKGKKGDTISILALKQDAIGVTLEKLEYPLNKARVSYLSPLGISNVMLEDECNITVEDGYLLVIRNLNV